MRKSTIIQPTIFQSFIAFSQESVTEINADSVECSTPKPFYFLFNKLWEFKKDISLLWTHFSIILDIHNIAQKFNLRNQNPKSFTFKLNIFYLNYSRTYI